MGGDRESWANQAGVSAPLVCLCCVSCSFLHITDKRLLCRLDDHHVVRHNVAPGSQHLPMGNQKTLGFTTNVMYVGHPQGLRVLCICR